MTSETRALPAGADATLAGGWLGYARRDGATPGSPVEQTVQQITVSVRAGRRVRVLWQGEVAATSSGTRARVRIKEGGTVLQERERLCAQVDTGEALTACVHLKPGLGSHTYTVTVDRASGKGVVHVEASPSAPAELVVEDVGPA